MPASENSEIIIINLSGDAREKDQPPTPTSRDESVMISSHRASLVLRRRPTAAPSSAVASSLWRRSHRLGRWGEDGDDADVVVVVAAAGRSLSTAVRRLEAYGGGCRPPPLHRDDLLLRRGPSSTRLHGVASSRVVTIQARRFAGRKDRASTSLEVRPPTPKQRKRYHRRRRELEYEKEKHSRPNSKASARRLEDGENTERLVEIALEEEALKSQLGAHFDKVNEIQSRIESSDKFRALLEDGTIPPDEVRSAARDAARRAAESSGAPRPPLPSWWRDRMTYDWGDALVDDLMGNSSDLTSSPSPYPLHMAGEYGRLRRKVERLVRGRREEERFLLETGGVGGGVGSSSSSLSSSSSSIEITPGAADFQRRSSASLGPIRGDDGAISDKLLSDLLRAYRDANGKRTVPVGLASVLRLLRELDVPTSSLGTYSYVSMLTCCASVWEGRKVDELRRDNGVRSNGHFWSALVDVYARGGDYRGAESVLDELLEVSRAEFDVRRATHPNNTRLGPPIAVPPLSAYTSFFSACHKLIARTDVHPSIKSDAANRAWSRWKEMRIHSVAPDVMAYGALMRIFAAQVIRLRVQYSAQRFHVSFTPLFKRLEIFSCFHSHLGTARTGVGFVGRDHDADDDAGECRERIEYEERDGGWRRRDTEERRGRRRRMVRRQRGEDRARQAHDAAVHVGAEGRGQEP